MPVTIIASHPQQCKPAQDSGVLKRTRALQRMRTARLRFLEAWSDWVHWESSDQDVVREFTRTECLLAEVSGVFPV